MYILIASRLDVSLYGVYVRSTQRGGDANKNANKDDAGEKIPSTNASGLGPGSFLVMVSRPFEEEILCRTRTISLSFPVCRPPGRGRRAAAVGRPRDVDLVVLGAGQGVGLAAGLDLEAQVGRADEHEQVEAGLFGAGRRRGGGRRCWWRHGG